MVLTLVCLCICLCICLTVYLPVCLSVYLSVCQSICLSVCLSVYLTICLSTRQCFILMVHAIEESTGVYCDHSELFFVCEMIGWATLFNEFSSLRRRSPIWRSGGNNCTSIAARLDSNRTALIVVCHDPVLKSLEASNLQKWFSMAISSPSNKRKVGGLANVVVRAKQAVSKFWKIGRNSLMGSRIWESGSKLMVTVRREGIRSCLMTTVD